MSKVLFFQNVQFVPRLFLNNFKNIKELCQEAGVPVKGSGAWIDRKIEIAHGDSLEILAEPGDWGAVKIVLNSSTPRNEARFALEVLADVLHDLVAKESIRGAKWRKLGPPLGRPRVRAPRSSRERQRRFRRREG